MDQLLRIASVYATNHVMIPIGDDFQYQMADPYFDGLDAFMR